MAKLPVPSMTGILRMIKRRKARGPIKIIFTPKGWAYFLLAVVISSAAAGGLTWWVQTQKAEALEAAAAQEAALYGGASDRMPFELDRIIIPEEFKGERTLTPGQYRVPRESWSEAEIRGEYGDGEWTDPARISSDIFSDKNDALVRNLLENAR